VTEQERLVAGRYRLGERLGAGAMGIVWRAHDERLRRSVAVKQLLLQAGLTDEQAEGARQRAFREARIAARLHHANVVIVFDVAEDDGQPWLIMEYVPSSSLATALLPGPLTPDRVAGIGAQAAAGLAAAHAVGVVHRDVKPGNVLLGDDGVVKIADFGISRAVDDVRLTATGLLTGTPAYLAPEMAKGDNPAPPSDVFALGATLYAAVEGIPPFGLNENPLALLYAVAGGRVTPPSNAGRLTGPLMELLRPDPADRPTMREAQAALAAIAPGRIEPVDAAHAWTTPALPPVPDQATRVPPPGPADLAATGLLPVGPPARRRHRAQLALVIAVVVLAVGVALVLVDTAGSGGGVAGPAPTVRPSTTAPAVAPVVNSPPTFAAMSATVSAYYALLPGDVTAAYRMLSTRYRVAHPLAEVRGFYAGIRSVGVSGFTPVGANSVRAVVTFVTNGGVTTHEPYRFTVVRRHGTLLIDSALPVARTAGM
jgi:hypothetical protein